MAEAWHYWDEYEGMKVANATCPMCAAKYLAWCSESNMHRTRYGGRRLDGLEPGTFGDLSFRSSFNDEPGIDDLPLFAVEPRRVGPAKPCGHAEWYERHYPDEYATWIARRDAAWVAETGAAKDEAPRGEEET